MKTLHLLLGGAEKRTNSTIQTTILDLCYNRAAVTCTRSMRPAEFLRQGCCGSYDLMILDVDHQLTEAGRPEPTPESLVQVVWTLKNQCSSPLIVLGAAAEMEYRFLEAGAEAVLTGQWRVEDLRAEVERQLALPQPEQAPRRRNWSLAGLFGGRA